MTKQFDIEEEQVDELIEKAQALAGWHEINVIQAIDAGVKEKWDIMLKDIGNGKLKNNKYNEGYMRSLLDLHYSLEMMLKNIITEEELSEELDNEEETQTEGETNE